MQKIFTTVEAAQSLLANFMEAGVPRETVMAVFHKTALPYNRWETGLASVPDPSSKGAESPKGSLAGPETKVEPTVPESQPKTGIDQSSIRVFTTKTGPLKDGETIGWVLASPVQLSSEEECPGGGPCSHSFVLKCSICNKQGHTAVMCSLFRHKGILSNKKISSVEDKIYCINEDLVFVVPDGKYAILVGRFINRKIQTLDGTRPLEPRDWEAIQNAGLEYMTKHEAAVINDADPKLYQTLDNFGLIPEYK